jgi:hypothetical protein
VNGHSPTEIAADVDACPNSAKINNEKPIKLVNMETLIFAFIAVRHLYNPQETFLAEAAQLRPFDLQSLRYVYGARERSTNRPTDRNDSHLAQALS